jgi:hypothetical protein
MQPNEAAKGEQLDRNCRLMLVFAVWPEVEEAPCNLLGSAPDLWRSYEGPKQIATSIRKLHFSNA